MEPGISPGQTVTALRADALTGRIDRGDVIVFDGRGSFFTGRAPEGIERLGPFFGIGARDVYVVKRVIGVGGDEIRCCDADGRLLLNGEPLDEPYLPAGIRASDIDFSVAVPDGRVFVLGDNREDSTDSRNLLGRPGGGMILEQRIVGTVIGHGSSADGLLSR